MSNQVSISQLPIAGPLTGTEQVPIVQNGQTVQTTTSAISGAGSLNFPLIAVGTAAGLPQGRYLSTGSGLSLTDNGVGKSIQINVTGAVPSLNSAGNGLLIKTNANTVSNTQIAVGSGLTIANPDGTTGYPTIGLGTFLSNFNSLTGTGILAIQSGTVGKINVLGTSNQISVANGTGVGDITIALSNNPIIPGNASLTLPIGTTSQRPVSSYGQIRYNTDLGGFEGYMSTGWELFSVKGDVFTFSAGSTGLLPNTPTSGAITLSGTLNTLSGGTGVAGTLSGFVFGNGVNPMTTYSGTGTGNVVLSNSPTISGAWGSPDSLQFNTAATVTPAVGKLYWDGGSTLNFGMTTQTVQSIGEDIFYYIKASAAITQGQVVMFTGAVGASGVLQGAPATGVTKASYIMGVASENIPLNGFGMVQSFGLIQNLNTSAYAPGTVLYFDPTVVGGLTATQPLAPNIKVQLAAVVNQGTGNGSIFVRRQETGTFNNVDEVQISSPTANQVLSYNGSYWTNTVAAFDATNVLTTLNTTNTTNYIAFLSASSGYNPVLVNSSLTFDAATGAITGGIAGGSF